MDQPKTSNLTPKNMARLATYYFQIYNQRSKWIDYQARNTTSLKYYKK